MSIVRMIKMAIFNALHPVQRVYWRVAKPETYGVKVTVERTNKGNREILLVQTSYGATNLWNLPGGGYRPVREDSKDAARRELREETDLDIEEIINIGEYKTAGEGKKDTVSIFYHSISDNKDIQALSLSSELSNFKWASFEEIKSGKLKTARITRYALQMIMEKMPTKAIADDKHER